jgi:S-adenosylmethionine hydrolase
MRVERRHFFAVLVLAVAAAAGALAGCGGRAPEAAKSKTPATIVFMTDFGTANDAVAICKAVMLRIAPDARIMDITHQATPFSIQDGARWLAGVTPYYPAETVFVVVIDPTVGSARKALVVKTKKGQLFVLPDNGLITPVADRDGVEGAREITNTAWMIGDKISSTFHGRDIFSPTGAHLAMREDWTQAGPVVTDLVRLQTKSATVGADGITGDAIGLDDPFGSLVTDIGGDDFKNLGYALGEEVPVKIGGKSYTFPYEKTFANVPVGKPLIYVDSRGRISIAVNQGDFSKVYKTVPPEPVFIAKKD